MKIVKTIFLVMGLTVLGFGMHLLYAPLIKKVAVPVSWADDEEEDEEYEDEERDEGSAVAPAENASSSKASVTYKTVTTKLPDTVVETTKVMPRYDTDKDGLYDDEDPHPTINEFLIISDNNNNGIDDRYEQ